MRVRLYPLGNGCEKNALFTPQMYDVVERAVVAEAIAQARAANRPFVFVDIGANVGLYSLYAASAAGPEAKILAFEPQPGIADRLSFNVASNPGAAIALHRIALSDREGTVRLVINNSDSGGTHVAKDGQVAPSAEAVEVACRPLATVLAEAGVAAIDVLKIDVEGAEDIVLGSFLRDQPHAILPRLIIIEDTSAVWNLDLFGLMEKRGYQRTGRSRHNIVWAMSPEAPV